jgi:serine/threonine-protein kinase RsbW
MADHSEARLWRISLELPNEAQTVGVCRKMLRTLLGDMRVEAEQAVDIELALSEAATNAVRHAYAHPGHLYCVTVEVYTDRVCLQVEDEGIGFVRTAAPEPDVEQLGGRGLWLIEQLADRTCVRTVPGGGCLLEAEFSLLPPRSRSE